MLLSSLLRVTMRCMPFVFPPLSPDAPIFVRVLPRLRELTEEAFAAALEEVPESIRLAHHDLMDEMIPLALENAGLFLRSLYSQQPVTPADLAKSQRTITRLAEDRVPLTAVIGSFFSGIQVFWAAVAGSAGPEDAADLAAFGAHIFSYMQLTSTMTAEIYSSVGQSMFGAEREARRSLCSALLRGDPAADLAAQAGVTLADRYDVVTIVTGVDHRPADATEVLLTRRWVRATQELLDELAKTSVLTSFDGISGTALLPSGSAGVSAVRELAYDLAEHMGVEVFAAVISSVRLAEIPDALAENTEVVELARSLGRKTGVHKLTDMLLEYQITRPGPARDLIIAKLAPVVEQQHLMEALEAHIRHGLDRKPAAAALHVHPNTFSYRLRRVAELTGIDPTDPSGSRLLAAALTIRRVSAAET